MNQIDLFRLKVLRSGLGLEMKGMHLSRGRRSCYVIIKRELGFKGTRQRVFDQITEHIKQLER